MKNFLNENWFKLGILLIAILWVFFGVIFPRYVGSKCYEHARKSILESDDTSNLKARFDDVYELCRAKRGY